jgi:hypothetical protein
LNSLPGPPSAQMPSRVHASSHSRVPVGKMTVVSAVPRNALLPILKMTAGHKNVLSWEQ